MGVLIFQCSCSSIKKISLSGSGGASHFLESDFKTSFQKGELDPNLGYSIGVGAGYYGLLNNLNLSFEVGRANHKSKSLNEKMNLLWKMGFADYYFSPQKPTTLFAGMGIGKVATSFFKDSPEDEGDALSFRLGHGWKLKNPTSIVFARGVLTKVESTKVRRFYFFGSSAEVKHLYAGVEVGLILNLFSDQTSTPQ